MISGAPKGTQLERLVAMLEKMLARSAATIETRSRRLRDRDTGRRREQDVLIVWDHGHHKIITAIECRDRKRPVGVPDVEAFADKCDATGVHSGMIVSASGFRQSARDKASARSIGCMTLDEVERFDWLAMDAITGFERQFGEIDARLMFVDALPSSIRTIYDCEDNIVSEAALFRTIQNAVPPNDNPDAHVGVTIPIAMQMNTPNWRVEDGDGNSRPLDHIFVRTSYTTVKLRHEVRTHRYTGGGKDYEVISADAVLGGAAGTILLVRDDNGHLTMSFQGAEEKVGPLQSDNPPDAG